MKTFMRLLCDLIIMTAVKAVGIAMLLSILIQIISRLFLKVPFPWTDELSRGAFIWFCFLGSAMAMRRHAHLGIDYFRSKLRKRGRLISDILVSLAVIAFGAAVCCLGIMLLEIVGYQLTPIMRISMKWFYLAVPACGGLMTLQGVEFLIHYLTTREPRQLIEEATLPPADAPLV